MDKPDVTAFYPSQYVYSRDRKGVGIVTHVREEDQAVEYYCIDSGRLCESPVGRLVDLG